MKAVFLLMSIPALLITSAPVLGNSLTVELTGTTVSDGQYYVLPYQLTIDGIITQAICYDFADEIVMGQFWQANQYDLSDAEAYGEFGGQGASSIRGYETVAYLASFWYTGSLTTGQEIDLQHAIWDVFTPGAYTIPTSDQLISEAVTNEATGINSFQNYGDYTFLEAIPDPTTGYVAQPFVLYTPGNNENPPVPEPGSAILLAIGAMLIGVSKIRPPHRQSAWC